MGASPALLKLWRVFPWDSTAAEGQPFSPIFVIPGQFSGRFDLGGRPAVFYLGESPTHAIAERIQRYRGQTLEAPDLREYGKPLALVEVSLPESLGPIADLADPGELLRYDFRPDALMSTDLTRTQAISRQLYDQGLLGFRVWSSLSGDWHSTVLFLDRIGGTGDLTFGHPLELTLSNSALLEAARRLSIGVGP